MLRTSLTQHSRFVHYTLNRKHNFYFKSQFLAQNRLYSVTQLGSKYYEECIE